MSDQAPFRHVNLHRSRLLVERLPSGDQLLRAEQPLFDHPLRLSDCLLEHAATAPERGFLAQRTASGEFRVITYGQALAYARKLGAALLARDLSAERPLAIISDNDIEHGLLALAALYVGVPFVAISPAYSMLSRDYKKLKYALELMTPGLVFASDGARFKDAIAASVPAETELLFTCNPSRAGALVFDEFVASAQANIDVERAREAVAPDHISKFLLTSGSTGMPKAVIHTQRMMTSNLQMIMQNLLFLTEEPPVLVDWLPWNHTFGGNHNYGITLWNGGTLYIDEGKPTRDGFQHTLRNLREVSPTVYFNVPRGFEELALALERDEVLAKSFFARVKMLFYAGASLSQDVWNRLSAVSTRTSGERIVIITGLGMTETAPYALAASWEAGIAGGLGIPAPGVTAKLTQVAGKLEVRYRGPSVTQGYWRQPELTAQAFDEQGYFRSGDAVRYLDANDPQRGLVFDGRTAEDFKLKTGTWVSVGPLRALLLLQAAPYLSDAVITGHDRDEVGALVLLDENRARALCSDLSPGATLAQLALHPKLIEVLSGVLQRSQAEATGSATRITRLHILTELPTIDRGELTDKGSINQRAVLDNRRELVERMYAATANTDAAVIFAS
ncbi:MAG TPA: feruloyl-CoA synthase [Polyangiales bacterium]|nr:feruloyl-CoA synthase [Polyangiales bacterium]